MAKVTVHSSNVTYFVICVLGIAAFFLVGIFPNYSALQDMDREASQLREQLKTQELLFPLYQRLIKEVTTEIPTRLPLPEKQKLSHDDFNSINRTFDRLADENQVVFVQATPDAANYLDDIGYLTMHADFTGDFFNLRQLLLGLCQLPWLESVDQMRIETADGQKRLALKVKIAQE